jgi:hypothetical protein
MLNQRGGGVVSKGSQKIVAKLRKEGKGWGGVAMPPPPTTPPPNPGNAGAVGASAAVPLSKMKAGDRLYAHATQMQQKQQRAIQKSQQVRRHACMAPMLLKRILHR